MKKQMVIVCIASTDEMSQKDFLNITSPLREAGGIEKKSFGKFTDYCFFEKDIEEVSNIVAKALNSAECLHFHISRLDISKEYAECYIPEALRFFG